MTRTYARHLWIVLAITTLVAGCARVDPEANRRRRGGDAIMLSDNTRLFNDGTSWSAGTPGVTANVIQAGAATEAAFEELEGGTLLFHDVPAWRSNEGNGDLTLGSSLQSATAIFDGEGYVLTGLTTGPAFADTDSLTVEAAEGGAVTVDAPPPLSEPTSLLGDPQGLRTEVSVPDGTFDTLYVYLLADDGSPGDDGLMRFVPAEDMALDGERRTAPLIDEEAIAALDSRGMSPVAIYVAYFNVAESNDFFPGRAVPVQAGRMFQVDPAEL